MRKRCRIDIIISIDKHDIATFGIIHPQIPVLLPVRLFAGGKHATAVFVLPSSATIPDDTIRRTVVYRYNLITTFWDRRRYNTLQTSLYIGFRVYSTGIIILISSITQHFGNEDTFFFMTFP